MNQHSEWLPSGTWTGFFLQDGLGRRGWMHLYLQFDAGRIEGEGTDCVGPWTLAGRYDLDRGTCGWTKSYVGRHQVVYRGTITDRGVVGHWSIPPQLAGEFHVWPVGRTELNEMYLQQDADTSVPPFGSRSTAVDGPLR